jgi:radical SAM protein with 4Fe4S-binding SPASM domain
MDWSTQLKHWFVPTPGVVARAMTIAPGMYHFQRERDGQYLRFHLRIELDGRAMLIAGASEAVRLSPAGAVAAKGLLEGKTPAQIAAELAAPSADQIVADVQRALDELGRPSARYPIFNLSDPAVDERAAQLLAPFQADVVAGERNTLRQILSRLWDAGIPHARLIWDEAADIEVLVEAVEHAEDLGMITGVRARAGQLATEDSVRQLAEVGLDYVVLPWMVTGELHSAVYDAGDYEQLDSVIADIRRWEMTAVLQTPLVQQTIDELEEHLPQLARWGVGNVEVFAVARAKSEDAESPADASGLQAVESPELPQFAAWIEDLADSHQLQMIWLPPVTCESGDSVEALMRRGPRAGGDVAVRVEADGQVIPPRGPRVSAGNLLQNSWDEIWQHAALERYRKRVAANTRCPQCPGMAICAADCPADPRGWSHER